MDIKKQETIAGTMKTFMESGPSVKDFPTYKSLNDYVGQVHDLAEGKCQALAGEKAWAWAKDNTTKTWRKATQEEIDACRANAATKNNGGTRKSKVLSDEDRESLDSQIDALVVVGNPALAPLLAELLARRTADDLARKGSMKDRLNAAIDKLGIERAVAILEEACTENA